MPSQTLARIRRFLPFLGLGLAVVAAMAGALLWVQRGAHLELAGSIQKVRTLALPDSATVAILDFRFVNTADYRFDVRGVEVLLDTADGRTLSGAVVSEYDARQLFSYYPILGQKYNQTLVARTRIAPHQSLDRMIAARFEIPEQQFEQRKGLRVRVEDVDGAVSEIGQPGR